MSNDWDLLSTKEKVDSIAERLGWIIHRDMYKEMRSRYSGGKDFEEEFATHEEDLRKIWMSAKENYCESKQEIDGWFEDNDISIHHYGSKTRDSFKAMKRVIEDEIEGILLDNNEDNI